MLLGNQTVGNNEVIPANCGNNLINKNTKSVKQNKAHSDNKNRKMNKNESFSKKVNSSGIIRSSDIRDVRSNKNVNRTVKFVPRTSFKQMRNTGFRSKY